MGPPGSGKSTYCRGMSEFLNGIGRKTIVVNLDPANEILPYECAINIDGAYAAVCPASPCSLCVVTGVQSL